MKQLFDFRGDNVFFMKIVLLAVYVIVILGSFVMTSGSDQVLIDRLVSQLGSIASDTLPLEVRPWLPSLP